MTSRWPEWAAVWTPLLQGAVKASSEGQYRLGVRHFLNWVEESQISLLTTRDIDNALAEYGWWVFERFGGRGKWRLHQAVHGVEHFLPATFQKLVLGRRSVKGWNHFRPPKSHPPLTWSLTCLLAVECCHMGHPGMGVAILTAFDCYLRVSEVGELEVRDVSDLEAMGDGLRGTLVSLERCKTGNNQSVTVKRPVVQSLLFQWVNYVRARSGHERGRLFPDPMTFRRLFAEAQDRLGWAGRGTSNAYFVPHSLRHGGASCDFIYSKRTLEEILLRGRWVSVMSTRRYIQQGPALMAEAMAEVPQWQREYGRLIAVNVGLWFPRPHIVGEV